MLGRFRWSWRLVNNPFDQFVCLYFFLFQQKQTKEQHQQLHSKQSCCVYYCFFFFFTSFHTYIHSSPFILEPLHCFFSCSKLCNSERTPLSHFIYIPLIIHMHTYMHSFIHSSTHMYPFYRPRNFIFYSTEPIYQISIIN